MAPPAAPPVRHGEIARSRQLIHDSRVRIASAKELIRQSQGTIRQHTYLKIVYAWCQETIRFERAESAVWGQISHSICFDCFVPLFQELAPESTPSPVPVPGQARRARPPASRHHHEVSKTPVKVHSRSTCP